MVGWRHGRVGGWDSGGASSSVGNGTEGRHCNGRKGIRGGGSGYAYWADIVEVDLEGVRLRGRDSSKLLARELRGKSHRREDGPSVWLTIKYGTKALRPVFCLLMES